MEITLEQLKNKAEHLGDVIVDVSSGHLWLAAIYCADQLGWKHIGAVWSYLTGLDKDGLGVTANIPEAYAVWSAESKNKKFSGIELVEIIQKLIDNGEIQGWKLH